MNFEKEHLILHSDFDYQTHSDTFVNYCETIILEDGTVVYAVPSHQEKLFELYANKYNMTVNEVKRNFAKNVDFFDVIIKDLSCVVIWYDSCFYINELNTNQLKSIGELIKYHCVSDSILNDIRRL